MLLWFLEKNLGVKFTAWLPSSLLESSAGAGRSSSLEWSCESVAADPALWDPKESEPAAFYLLW